MNEPLFKLQIVDQHGVVVQLPAGGTLESELVEACTRAIAHHGLGAADVSIRLALQDGIAETIERCVDAVRRRGVGFPLTEAHVLQDVRDALRDVLAVEIFTKRQIAWNSQDAIHAIRAGLQDVILTLKERTRGIA